MGGQKHSVPNTGRNQFTWFQYLSHSDSNQDHVVFISRHIDQWDRIENPEIEPHKNSQPIFDKSAKATQSGKTTSRQMVLEQLDIHRPKKSQ